MSGIVESMKSNINSLLSIRDELGAALKPVYIVTRTWSGTELGDGTAYETKVQMLPSPKIQEFTHDLRIREGGLVQAGDILLKMISKQTFENQAALDFSDKSGNVEKFYDVGGKLYRPIGVTEKYVTWNVLLRPSSDQMRYPDV